MIADLVAAAADVFAGDKVARYNQAHRWFLLKRISELRQVYCVGVKRPEASKIAASCYSAVVS